MAYTKKIWVDVPDPDNLPEIPEGQDSLARFDAENMNRIEEGIEEVSTNGAIGKGAVAKSGGGAVGSGASANGGFAGGDNASAKNGGGAVGFGALSDVGFAGGNNAKTVNAAGNSIDAIQLGTGVNPNSKTLQIYEYQLMKSDGTIPAERMPSKAPSGHGLGTHPQPYNEDMINSIQEVLHYGSGFYQVDRFSDNPTDDASWKPMLQLALSETTGVQLLMPYVKFNNATPSPSPRMVLRSIYEDVASDWLELIHSDNIGEYASKTEIKTYVGTGTYGEKNPNSITFSFVPSAVCIGGKYVVGDGTNWSRHAPFVWVYGDPDGNSLYKTTGNNDVQFSSNHLSWNGKELSWWHSAFSREQMNVAGETYQIIAWK